MNENYYKRFIKFLKNKEDILPLKKSSECNIFRHLIQMMGEELFNNRFSYYFFRISRF